MGQMDTTSDELSGFDAYEVRLGDDLRGERATLGKSLLDVQREIRIKAAYIAAIENCDPSVFPNQGFIAGYVRSYARYLKRDGDEVFDQFCLESGFAGVNSDIQKKTLAAKSRNSKASSKALPGPLSPIPLSSMDGISPSAVGSVLVLAVLAIGLAFGGYAVIQDIQRVEIAGVETQPAPGTTSIALRPIADGATPSPAAVVPSDQDLARLYQPRELPVPVLIARDGPIVDIDPNNVGRFPTVTAARPSARGADGQLDAVAIELGEPKVRETLRAPRISVVAERPAWVRVHLADGSILFEKILEVGEIYALPLDVAAPLLRAGNSGAVYLLVDDHAFGPIGAGTSVAKQVSLLPDDIRVNFVRVAEIPAPLVASVNAVSAALAE